MLPKPDLVLVQAACEGDAGAVEQLLLQHQPSLARFARKYCATSEDAEDAVQETLWVIYRKIGTLQVASAFVSWTFQIVRHQCYRLFHRNDPDAVSILDLESLEGDSTQSLALKHDLVAAVAHLPLAYRQVFILRDIQNMTAPETAAALGLTLQTVKSRLHRARQLMRQSLESWKA